ncbi:MAG: hypothetical protein CVU56_24475 [Deltaproteobacteria bacterium HGW-Deltaproteobacteria-14]|nr:MAG: hypothetical protein CVU56_24475 [Deltaproteobacteria bacterium HGW-Deltaproteobacteria-14]
MSWARAITSARVKVQALPSLRVYAMVRRRVSSRSRASIRVATAAGSSPGASTKRSGRAFTRAGKARTVSMAMRIRMSRDGVE